jgi:mannose-6-phosphate isomerase-like protein (cupin superfamily)
MPEPINLIDKFALIDEAWRPRIAAQANGQDIRLVKTDGLFPWHSHPDADEVFLCWKGHFAVHFRDRIVDLAPGEMIVVPRGVEHRTESKCGEVLIFEPSDVINTGDAATSEFTAPQGVHV